MIEWSGFIRPFRQFKPMINLLERFLNVRTSNLISKVHAKLCEVNAK